MKNIPGLDYLRCLAVLLVLWAHADTDLYFQPKLLSHFLRFIHLYAWNGVDLFFVLSGFLVSGLLFQEHLSTGTLDLKRFLIRRAFKIIPAFYFFILVSALYELVTTSLHGKMIFHVTHFLNDLFFLQSYRTGLWSHEWSLAVEVHFYLLLALLFNYLYQRGHKSGRGLDYLPTIVTGLFVTCLILRYITSLGYTKFDYAKEFEPTHLCLDILASGVLLRYLSTYQQPILAFFLKARIFWIVLGFILTLPSALIRSSEEPNWLIPAVPTLNYFGFGLILLQVIRFSPPSGLLALFLKPFRFIGQHSYSIYLWHPAVCEWLVNPLFPRFAERRLIYTLIYLTTSITVGILFSVILEFPILRLRDALFPSLARSKNSPANSPPGREAYLPRQ